MSPQEVIDQVKRIPAASDVARKLIALVCGPEPHVEDVVRVLRCDPALTSRLLRFCNSAFSGLSEPVASVDQAVLLLGQRQIFRLASSMSFGSAMAPALFTYAMDAGELWRHSLLTGFVAEHLASESTLGELDPSTAFTAALLHDIGKVAMDGVLGEETESAVRERVFAGSRSRAEAERDVLGFDHAAVGAALLQRWKFPEALVEAVANHHHPAIGARPTLSVLVHAADTVAHLVGSAPGWNGFAVRIDPGVERALGPDDLQISRAMITAHGLLNEVEQFLAVA